MTQESRKRALFIPVVLFFLVQVSCVGAGEPILKLSDGTLISFDETLEDLLGTQLVFIGELHNNLGHHRAQLRVIQALVEAGRKVAVGLEMFHDGHQEELDAWISGTMEADEFMAVYRHNWSHPWPLYRDIFIYARENGLPLVGLNASPDLTSQVAARGFDSLSPSQLEQLPGVSCNVDPEYEKFIRRALGSHDFGPGSFRNFCEAQMVWDTTMASRIKVYMENYPGTVMVVLAGSGHSWKRGIPEQIRRQSDLTFLTLLPEIGGRLTRKTASLEDTDYLWTGL